MMLGKRNLGLAGLVLVVAVAVLLGWIVFQRLQPQTVRATLPASSGLAQGAGGIPLAPPLELKPLSAEEAKNANDSLPFSTRPLEVASGVNLLSAAYDELSQRSSLDCMTAAIFYEAGYESDRGKRAVAQVILNRVRHPAFPDSVCAVVYQGSERRTGCQFTFTCDGSLARQPPRGPWEAARVIARAALSGMVEPTVGMATHYHADYVMPYWAPSLDKITQVGTHLFYTWKGGWGRRAAFNRVPVPEPMDGPADALAELVLPAELTPEQLGAEVTLGLSPIMADRTAGLAGPAARPVEGAAASPGADSAAGRLLADERAGRLLADEPQPPPSAP